MQAIDFPITFEPVFMTRVWGGRKLEKIYQKKLPADEQPYGESWEISDRPETQSIVKGNCSLNGKSLNHLWNDTDMRLSIFGVHKTNSKRFPLLLKILDCEQDLSIQVHPPEKVAKKLQGEAKTEFWYIASASQYTKIYAGLNSGVTKADFEKSIKNGTTAGCIYQLNSKSDSFLFLPSGRVHAIGGGNLIFEIQQNSDTTYRVFDWNRVGLDNRPRELHIKESMESIDFNDFEPSLTKANDGTLCTNEYFTVQKKSLKQNECAIIEKFSIIAVTNGKITSGYETFNAGDFFMVADKATSKVKNLISLTDESAILIIKLIYSI